MIQEFVDRFIAAKPRLMDEFSKRHPEDYKEIVRAVVSTLSSEDGWRDPDPDRIHQIDDGEYQGTLVFVIAAQGYQPSDYWYVRVGYGSCSGCDTLQAISSYSSEPPTPEQAEDYWTLALHVVQGLKKMGDDE